MNKGKTISIILNLIFIITIVILVIYIAFFNKDSKTNTIVDTINTKCTKTIQDEPNLKTYLEETITQDSNNAITNSESKVIYDIQTDETYNTIKGGLSSCTDTYLKDKKIVCNLAADDNAKTKIGTWAYKYIENSKTDGFTCELVK